VIGGRNKYMINGQTAQLGRIRDLFHSVQLDVNNPHFLIMQGRITKVLNMKPAEILGMIQEAAGTKMYELKKAQAIKTMSKKQVKVDEIQQILEAEITPQLEKLRHEKTHYLQWTKNNQEIDKLERLMVVYRFHGAKARVDQGSAQLTALKDEIHESEAQMEFLRDDIEKMKNDIAVKQAQKSRDEQGQILKLSEELNAANKTAKSLEQQTKNQRDNIGREEKALAAVQKQCRHNEKAMAAKKKEAVACEQRHAAVEERHQYLADRVDSLESQQLGIGMDDEKRDSGSLAQQLMEAKRLKSEYKAALTTTRNKIKNSTKELAKLQRQIKSHETKDQQLKSKLQAKQSELDNLKAQQAQYGHDSNAAGADEEAKQEAQLQRDINARKEQLYAVRNELQGLRREASRFDFEYTDPHRGFDRRKVHGKLAKLFQVENAANCRAIEICAGGRLYNVVVDHNETAKALLQKGRLKSRVTIIPLNKIASNSISAAVVEAAKQLVGDEHCNLALDLIGYDEQLEPAMKYVFGSSLICSDMNAAKQVAFEPNIRCKSVTLDGEVFNPQGLLTGGSNKRGPSILENMRVFAAKQQAHDTLQNEVTALERQLHGMAEKARRQEAVADKVSFLEHEISVLNDRIADSAHASLQGRIDELEASLAQLQDADLNELERKLATTEQKCKDLQHDMDNYQQRKKDQVKHVKKQIAECKKELTALAKKRKKATAEKDRLNQEVQHLAEEVEATAAQTTDSQQRIADAQAKCAEIEAELAALKARKKEIELALRAERKKLSAQDAELKKLDKIVAKNEKQHAAMDIACAAQKRELSALAETIKHARGAISAMLEKHEWLGDELEGAAAQEASAERQAQIAARSKQLKAEQSALGNRINHKVMSMFERAEAEYRDLIKKREIIRTDKKKIESVIRELDKKKKDTLETTHAKVNEHFGNIFGKLLPGTTCKLQKVKENDDDEDDDCNILDGLEVKVAFGTDEADGGRPIWKQSLSELSGGQRSLLALSLILSLLLFKPAPLYILDEIDAALDLSHTQNIGILIAKYFAKSQFIVVSLKEGMFTNANVIFRTSFIDGISAVKRTVGVSLKAQKKGDEENANKNNRNKSRRRPRARRRGECEQE